MVADQATSLARLAWSLQQIQVLVNEASRHSTVATVFYSVTSWPDFSGTRTANLGTRPKCGEPEEIALFKCSQPSSCAIVSFLLTSSSAGAAETTDVVYRRILTLACRNSNKN